jgi:hypothetical protein
VLAPLAFCDARRRPQSWFWLGLGLFGFAFHADVPLISGVFRIFPFTALRNNRFTFYTGWSLVALAVTGLEALLAGQVRWRLAFWPVIGLVIVAGAHAGLCLVVVPAHFEALGQLVQADWFRLEYAWELVVCAAALGAWFLVRRRHATGANVAQAVCGLVLVELLINAWGANPQCDRAHYYPTTPLIDALREGPPGRVSLGTYLRPNVNMMYGLAEIRGYDGADPRRVIELFRVVDPEWSQHATHALTHSFDPPVSPIMDMLGLRYVFRYWPAPDGARVFARDLGGWIEERETALPRVWVPRRIEPVADDAQCLERLGRADFDPRETAFVMGWDGISRSSESSGTGEITAEVPSRVVIAARMETAGVLVLADTWDAGWKAFVDGRATDVLRMNYLLRGVLVPPGKHTVEFRYEPASFTWGVRLFVVSAALLAGWGVLVLRSRDEET